MTQMGDKDLQSCSEQKGKSCELLEKFQCCCTDCELLKAKVCELQEELMKQQKIVKDQSSKIKSQEHAHCKLEQSLMEYSKKFDE